MLRPAFALVLALSACDRSAAAHEPTGLVTSPPAARPVDVTKARRDTAEFGRAVAQPWRLAAAALGNHRLTIDSDVTVRDGAAVLEQLGEHTVIDSAASGDFHATADNSADYGREVVWLGGQLFLRPRYARWHLRPIEAEDEPLTIRDQIAAVLGDYFELCARGVELSDKGSLQVAGRAGHRIELKLAPTPRSVAKASVVQRSWRDTAVVTAASGEVVLDDDTGVALAARLTAEVRFERDGKPLTMALTVTHTVEALATPAIAAPAADQVVTTPIRSREVDDRNTLLRGIAPPERKAAPIDEPPGAAP